MASPRQRAHEARRMLGSLSRSAPAHRRVPVPACSLGLDMQRVVQRAQPAVHLARAVARHGVARLRASAALDHEENATARVGALDSEACG